MARKAAKKTVNSKKKVASKTTTSKTKKAAQGREFFLKDGRMLSTITELKNSLKDMKHDVFDHHVNEWKHDFAKWVHDVFEDKKLAVKLEKAKNLTDIQVVLSKNSSTKKKAATKATKKK